MPATPPTPQYVRDLSLSGEFAAIADPPIQDIIDEDVIPLYSAPDAKEHTQWTRVVGLHTAHLLHVQLKLEAADGDIGALAGVSARALQGVGSRSKAIGALNPADMLDLMEIPSIYNMRLQRILQTFPVSIHTTSNAVVATTAPVVVAP